jgi:hypothetical protein
VSDVAVLRNSAKPKFLNNNPRTFLGTCEMRLFKNNLSPIDPDGATSQFTEVTDSGYAPVAGSYAVATLNGSDQGQSVGDVLQDTFSHAGGDFVVYGAYWTDPGDSDEWVCGVIFSSPQSIVAPGQITQVAPVALLDTFTP